MQSEPQSRITRAQWMALSAALLGWMFDGAEMGVFSMVARPALTDLLGTSDDKQVGPWIGIIIAGFLVGAATGGVLFGWLGDRIGRVRAMTLSVFTYAVFTGVCGLVTDVRQLWVLRFIAALGMGGEWSLGVALVMEVWPNRSRAFMAGLIGAAANVGYLLVGFVGLGLNAIIRDLETGLLSAGLSEEWVKWLVANQGWRLMMVLGTFPALLTFFIRLFVPESERWKEEQQRGGTSSWATQDLLGVGIGMLGPALIVFLWMPDGPDWRTLPIRLGGTLLGLIVATLGYIYPVYRYVQRQQHSGRLGSHTTLRRMLLAACLSGVALLGTWGSTQWAPSWADKLAKKTQEAAASPAPDGKEAERPVVKNAKEWTQIWLAVGAIVGTIAAALLGDWLGRRVTYFLLCVLSFGSVYLLFQTNEAYGTRFLVTTFVAGVCTASFYGWLPLYLPELFPTAVRATGQGFGFNFGRILAAIGALQTSVLFERDIQLGSWTLEKGYPSACTIISLIYVFGVAIIWLAPETRGRPLPE